MSKTIHFPLTFPLNTLATLRCTLQTHPSFMIARTSKGTCNVQSNDTGTVDSNKFFASLSYHRN